MAGVDGTQKIMEHIHLQPGNWSCWEAQGLIYGTPESGLLIFIGTGSWEGLGVGGQCSRARGTAEWWWAFPWPTLHLAVLTIPEHSFSPPDPPVLGREPTQRAVLTPQEWTARKDED